MPSPTLAGGSQGRLRKDSMADEADDPDLVRRRAEAMAEKLRREADRFLMSRPREEEQVRI